MPKLHVDRAPAGALCLPLPHVLQNAVFGDVRHEIGPKDAFQVLRALLDYQDRFLPVVHWVGALVLLQDFGHGADAVSRLLVRHPGEPLLELKPFLLLRVLCDGFPRRVRALPDPLPGERELEPPCCRLDPLAALRVFVRGLIDRHVAPFCRVMPGCPYRSVSARQVCFFKVGQTSCSGSHHSRDRTPFSITPQMRSRPLKRSETTASGAFSSRNRRRASSHSLWNGIGWFGLFRALSISPHVRSSKSPNLLRIDSSCSGCTLCHPKRSFQTNLRIRHEGFALQ